jgi:hypothetical protein
MRSRGEGNFDEVEISGDQKRGFEIKRELRGARQREKQSPDHEQPARPVAELPGNSVRRKRLNLKAARRARDPACRRRASDASGTARS